MMKDGVTVYFLDGKPVFAESESGAINDPEEVTKIATTLELSIEDEPTEEVIEKDLNDAGYDFGQGFVQGLNNIAGDLVGNTNRTIYGTLGGTLGLVDFMAGIFGVETPDFLKTSRDWTKQQWDDAGRLVREGLIQRDQQ